MDVDARVQLFDLKSQYRFECLPGVDKYNMPLYSLQTEGSDPTSSINYYPVYQGFLDPCFINGIQVPFYTRQTDYWNLWPNYLQSLNPAATGDGSANYTLSLPFFPALPGHIDITGIINIGGNPPEDPPRVSTLNLSVPATSVYSCVFFTATDSTGNTVVASDSGQFLDSDANYGLLLRPGPAPYGNLPLSGGYSTSLNTVNYATGEANVTFTDAAGNAVNIPDGNPIQAQCYFFQSGIPRAVLFYNNTITLRPPPNIPYLVEMTGYLSPAAFMTTSASLPFAYMAEYIARGAARKVLSDTGDWEQFTAYEPLFIEQERLVWKRSQRQFTATRTPTLFSENQFSGNVNSLGQGVS